MLLAAFLRHFDALPAERYRTLGASSAGSCARRLAMAQFPERYTPERMGARRRARLMAGREFERVVQGVIQKELPAEAAGETAFLWPVPVDATTMGIALEKVASDRLYGHVLPENFRNDAGKAFIYWQWSCQQRGYGRLGGIVLDPDANTVYIPALSDGIADLSSIGYDLCTQEFKTMATAGFRRVLGGKLDYGYRTQFAVQVDAANLNTHVGMFYRLETSHAIEIVYSRKATSIRATFTLTNGSQIVTEHAIIPPAEEWDEVVVEHPFDPKLLDDARARIARVLASTMDALPEREVGPSFVCEDCHGTGQVKCSYCDAGISRRSKKACGAKGCEAGIVPCGCGGGQLAEQELPFPCNGWCPFLSSCWVNAAGEPLYRIEKPKRPGDAGGRPRFVIRREDFEASGITFTSPEERT